MKTKRNLIQIWLLCAAALQTVTSEAQTVTKIAGGGGHSLFVKSDGSLWAMGADNPYGQLGDGTYNDNNQPQQIIACNVTAIAAGQNHSLFLKSDGSLWAMGDNQYGALGNGTYNKTNRPEQIVASNVTAIAAGNENSLFLKSDGSLWAMGNNGYGQLGDGTYYQTNLPERIVASNVTAIAEGGWHSLFLKSDGSLWGMGANYDGQLGDGTYNTRTNLPEQIVASNVTAIAAGYEYSLFLKSDGSLWAMGNNGYGQLGDGTYNRANLPEQIVASNVTAIAAGIGGHHSLFLKSDGSLWAMGRDDFGQLGDGTYNQANLPEENVASNVRAIAAGQTFSLFLKSDGSLWGMGNDGYGQLGDGRNSNTNRPEQILAGSNCVLTNIVVTPANPAIAAGSNLTFTATGYFSDGSSSGLSSTNGLVWSSSNPSVAAIDTNGVATGLSAGTITISATCSNVVGSTVLTVVVPPGISLQPTNNTVSPNSSVTLSVSASGGDLSYQWQLNGTNIAGATGPTLAIPSVTSTNIGVYTVIVSNPAGSMTSQAAIVGTTGIEMFAGVIVYGPLGSNYVIQATSDLSSGNWTTLTNVALPSQPYIFIDYDSPTNRQQFYQAVPVN